MILFGTFLLQSRFGDKTSYNLTGLSRKGGFSLLYQGRKRPEEFRAETKKKSFVCFPYLNNLSTTVDSSFGASDSSGTPPGVGTRHTGVATTTRAPWDTSDSSGHHQDQHHRHHNEQHQQQLKKQQQQVARPKKTWWKRRVNQESDCSSSTSDTSVKKPALRVNGTIGAVF